MSFLKLESILQEIQEITSEENRELNLDNKDEIIYNLSVEATNIVKKLKRRAREYDI